MKINQKNKNELIIKIFYTDNSNIAIKTIITQKGREFEGDRRGVVSEEDWGIPTRGI